MNIFNRIYITSSARYNVLKSIDAIEADALYFVEDLTTKCQLIYMGQNKIGGSFIVENNGYPTEPKCGVIYYISGISGEESDFVGFYDGTKWVSFFDGSNFVTKDKLIEVEEVVANTISKIIESTGIVNSDGVIDYNHHSTANYISSATSIDEATVLLDSAIKGVDSGLSTRLAVNLNNIDADGEAKIKEIAGSQSNLKHYKEDDNSAYIGTYNLEDFNVKGFSYTVDEFVVMSAVENGTGSMITANEDGLSLGYAKEADFQSIMSFDSNKIVSTQRGVFNGQDRVSKIQLSGEEAEAFPIQLEVKGQYEGKDVESAIGMNHVGVLIAGQDIVLNDVRINNEGFKYKNNDVLTTANEWYGTQSEFDALTEYQEGVNYYIYD